MDLIVPKTTLLNKRNSKKKNAGAEDALARLLDIVTVADAAINLTESQGTAPFIEKKEASAKNELKSFLATVILTLARVNLTVPGEDFHVAIAWQEDSPKPVAAVWADYVGTVQDAEREAVKLLNDHYPEERDEFDYVSWTMPVEEAVEVLLTDFTTAVSIRRQLDEWGSEAWANYFRQKKSSSQSKSQLGSPLTDAVELILPKSTLVATDTVRKIPTVPESEYVTDKVVIRYSVNEDIDNEFVWRLEDGEWEDGLDAVWEIMLALGIEPVMNQGPDDTPDMYGWVYFEIESVTEAASDAVQMLNELE